MRSYLNSKGVDVFGVLIFSLHNCLKNEGNRIV